MKITEKQLISIIRESAEKVINEIGYHEKQKRDQSEEEHEAWLAKKSAAKKRYQQEKCKDEKPSDSKAIDYYDYKHGKGGFPEMENESIRMSSSEFNKFITESVKNIIKEMMIPDDGCCEETDSLGQVHGSMRLDQEGDFAKQIFSLMRTIEEDMAEIENEKEENGDWDDENTYQYYLALKRAYQSLDELVHLQNSDY